MGSCPFPVLHRAFGQRERLSLFGALARTTLATRPGEDDDADSAECEDASADTDENGAADGTAD